MKNLISKDEKERIESICKKYNILDYAIYSDGEVTVNGDVVMSDPDLNEIPIQFGTVMGLFNCHGSNLTTLKGSPHTVINFNCAENNLTSLEYGPSSVEKDYFCYSNKLQSLLGSPHRINGIFNCNVNELQTLEGGPETANSYECEDNDLTTLVGGPHTILDVFDCDNNSLTSLVGAPHTIGGVFHCSENKLTTTFSGDVDIEIDGDLYHYSNNLPQLLESNSEHIKLILKYQRHFSIWNEDLSLNVENFQELIDEIRDGLL